MNATPWNKWGWSEFWSSLWTNRVSHIHTHFGCFSDVDKRLVALNSFWLTEADGELVIIRNLHSVVISLVRFIDVYPWLRRPQPITIVPLWGQKPQSVTTTKLNMQFTSGVHMQRTHNYMPIFACTRMQRRCYFSCWKIHSTYAYCVTILYCRFFDEITLHKRNQAGHNNCFCRLP